MSTKLSLNDRREALEESFFKKENEALLRKLRDKKELHERAEALASAMAFDDEALAEQLVEVGFRAETWFAISLVPLVEVAWADREVASAERKAIVEAAVQDGIAAGSEARALLDSWLEKRPPAPLREAWRAYIAAVLPVLGDTSREILRQETLDRARSVASAAGGFLGLGNKISDVEEAVLEDLATAF